MNTMDSGYFFFLFWWKEGERARFLYTLIFGNDPRLHLSQKHQKQHAHHYDQYAYLTAPRRNSTRDGRPWDYPPATHSDA